MTIFQAIFLGVVQGVTEFLPISSSGHLVLTPNLLGWNISSQQAFAFDVFLQAATLLAVVSFFFSDLSRIFKETLSAIRNKSFKNLDSRLGIYLILSTLPASIIGLTFNSYYENLFSNPLITSILLICNALILMSAEWFGKAKRDFGDLGWFDSIWIGIFQILALFPGISRSGVTITSGMLRNLDRQSSARYSFLISIPLLFGAGLNGFHKFLALQNTTLMLPIFIVGSIVSAFVGYLSIKWLLKFLASKSLSYFAIYCLFFGFFNLTIFYIKSL